VEDIFDFRSRLKYIWDNQWKARVEVMAKLNRFYVPKDGRCQQGGFVGRYVIKGDCNFFVFYPIHFCYILGEPNSKRGGIFCMNVIILTDPNAIAGMSKLWDGLKTHVFFMFKLHRVVKYYKLFCIRNEKEVKQLGKDLRSRLKVIQKEL